MSVYIVSGMFKYRGHLPGETFIATLAPDVEERAVKNGFITVLLSGPVTLDESKIRYPKG